MNLYSSLPRPVWFAAVFLFLCSRAWSQDFYLAEPRPPVIPAATFKLLAFGAVGDGKTLNTEAFRKAINACGAAGGGSIVVSSGVYLTGPIVLGSHMALVLEKGSVVKASERFAEFGVPEPLPSTQAELDAIKKGTPLISASNETDIAIRGEGTIDGNGVYWWAMAAKPPIWAAGSIGASQPRLQIANATPGAPASPAMPGSRLVLDHRPNMVVLHDCERVCVQGVTFLNPPMFHFVPSRCREVLVENVKVLAPPDAPNTDGIDPSNCQNVLIRNCLIDTGDDDIAIKAGGAGAPVTENITVTGCTIKHGHGISIGSETDAGLRNFLVQNCSFDGADNGLRIKSGRKRGGLVENVLYRDITMKNVALPITISLFYNDKTAAANPERKPVTSTTPMVRGVRFLNVRSEGPSKRAVEIIGLPESPVTDVRFENVRIDGAAKPLSTQSVANLDTKGLEVSIVPPSDPARRNSPPLPATAH
jgi:polygalacturonase